MASIEQLEQALVNADAAGDAAAARALAGEITRMRSADSSQGGDNGFMARANALTGGIIEGVPIVGPYIKSGAERAAAGVRSLISGQPYEDELRVTRDFSRQSAEKNPGTALAGNIAGGVAGIAPLVMAAPAAFGAGAGSMGMRSVASMLSGGGIGAADAAVRSDGDLNSTGIGGLSGAVVGGFAPTVAAGLGKGVTALADRIGGLSKPTGPIAGIPRPAANYALEAMGDPAKQAALQAELQRLGPQAMLADVSPEWMGVARGAASRPGMRDEIVTPLLNRDAAKNARLRGDMNDAIGPAPVPSQIEGGIAANQQALGPQYGAVFQNARAVDTEPIAHLLEADAVNLRGPAQRAVQQLRGMLDIHGAPGNLDPNPVTLFQTRQAIDGMLAGETNPQVIRTLSNYRQRVDDVLGQAVPGIKEVDAQFAELARQRDALGRGQQVLDSGRTAPRPQELAQEVSQGALPQGRMVGPSAVPLRMREGARAEIDRIVGTNANDPAALQRLMRSEGDWNRDRLRTLFGRRADDVLNAIDRETAFYRTNNRVTSGSDTAMANRFGDFLDNAATPNAIPTDTTVTGALMRGMQKVGQKALGSDAEAKAAKFAEDLGKLSVAQGGARDDIVRALMEAVRSRQSLEPINDTAREIARLLLVSSPPVANQHLIAR